jgi:hypothetical protein
VVLVSAVEENQARRTSFGCSFERMGTPLRRGARPSPARWRHHTRDAGVLYPAFGDDQGGKEYFHLGHHEACLELGEEAMRVRTY